MTRNDEVVPKWSDALAGRFLRFAAGGWIPARWFCPGPPPAEARAARTGSINLEIVSHCWQYAHLLAYQLSSLVNHPPTRIAVTMTVYHSAEDAKTVRLLERFGRLQVPNVTWNWRCLPRQKLFRRAIGRNEAALMTQADWVWFTDCDLIFHDGCLDAIADALQGLRDALVFPRVENCTPLLEPDNPMLNVDLEQPLKLSIDTDSFVARSRSRATGPLQITHGDVARACGYCKNLPYYQQPAETWCKAHEDRAFRWLLRTQGRSLEIPGVYRIRHVHKGRYTGGELNSGVRRWTRRIESRLKGLSRW